VRIATHESCPLGKSNGLLLIIEERMNSKAPCLSSIIASNFCPMSGELTKSDAIIAQTKRTNLLHLGVCIKIKSTMILVLQSSEVFSAIINTRFQTTGNLDFDSSHYGQTIIRLDRVKEERDRITCPAQFRILMNERCNLY
jgi:hypothetical protein